jgi:shikimate kinase
MAESGASCACTAEAHSATVRAVRQALAVIQLHRLADILLFGTQIAQVSIGDKRQRPDHDQEKQNLEKTTHPPRLSPTSVVRASGGLTQFIYGLFGKITPNRPEILNKRIGAALAYQLQKTVVMVGMMGSGKTAIGTAVARTLNVPFLDSDAEIERAANMTIAEIFDRDGEAFFRRKERQVLARLLKAAPGVLSTGGGAFLTEANRKLITERGVSVWLKADLELLWTRVRHKNTRPLLRTANPRKTLAELYAQRVPQYALADLTVETRAEYAIADTAARVLDALATRPDVLTRDETV